MNESMRQTPSFVDDVERRILLSVAEMDDLQWVAK
jgi:hypothetical protein